MLRSEVAELARQHVPGLGQPEIVLHSAGIVNDIYRVQRDGRWYALRLVSGDCEDGFDRDWEYRVIQCASGAGLAPLIEYCGAPIGVLVSRWVPGESWSSVEVRLAANIVKISEFIRSLQTLPIPMPAREMSPRAWIDLYRERSRSPLNSRAEQQLEILDAQPRSRAVLCHSDLHPGNLIEVAGGLIALDWEYSHVSDVLWDLVGWGSANDFTLIENRGLLTQFLGRTPQSNEWARFDALAWIYDYMCLLWCELYLSRRPDDQSSVVAARAATLAGRLGA
jgi:aminoglycoside phosphotransferase (APT) family kinase protein